jgi:putative membrane protein
MFHIPLVRFNLNNAANVYFLKRKSILKVDCEGFFIMKKNYFHIFLLTMVIAFFIWSIIKPAHYPIWILEVGPSVITILAVLYFYNKVRFTSLSYSIIAILTIMTFIGGHFTYDDVPLFDWIQKKYELERNHYDRFGHLLKGLTFIVIREILILKTALPIGKWVQFIAINVTLSLAGFYEIVEWIASRISNRKTKDFVGAQGDIWDAQWDMSLTLAGSIITLLLLTRLHNRFIKSLNNKSWS